MAFHQLKDRNCANHAEREAAARCVGCGRDFCRECVTEHVGRLLCVNCMRAAAVGKGKARGGYRRAWLAIAAAAGFFLVWSFFYLVGASLANIPDTFHKGGSVDVEKE